MLDITRGYMTAKNKPLNIDRDELYQLYIVEKLSSPQISKRYGCSARSIQNYLKKYGIKTRSFSEANSIFLASRSKEDLEKRAERFRKTWYSHSEEERDRINKTKATKPENIESAVKKSMLTKMKHNSGTKSKAEDDFYKTLKISFKDVIRQYYDEERYPFNCDFYIPSKDIFIEYQGHPTHGNEPYNKDSIEHQKIIREHYFRYDNLD